MTRIHIICEGQTEETFVKELLSPHFERLDVHLSPSLIGKPGHKGGNVKFERLFTDIRNRLTGDTSAYCTTFFDFYALPTDFPGKSAATKKTSIKDKAECIQIGVETELEAKLGSTVMQRFIPYVQMYEFEALLFSDPMKFAKGIDIQRGSDFQAIRNTFSSPEEINDSPLTAPSKRIEKLVDNYEKPIHGVFAALEIGLPAIRQACKLFDAWIKTLEALKP